jgi:uncharacterized protein (DUF433 family)
MDWTGCELVECVPGKVSGQPIVVGTRAMPDVIVEEFDDGMSVEDIWDNYPSLTPEMIRSLIAFQHRKRTAA